MIISIHYLVDNIFNDRDYLFESNETELILYAHLMNISIETILVCNDDKQAVKISRNYRLNYLTELDYSNAFFVRSKSSESSRDCDSNFVKQLDHRNSNDLEKNQSQSSYNSINDTLNRLKLSVEVYRTRTIE